MHLELSKLKNLTKCPSFSPKCTKYTVMWFRFGSDLSQTVKKKKKPPEKSTYTLLCKCSKFLRGVRHASKFKLLRVKTTQPPKIPLFALTLTNIDPHAQFKQVYLKEDGKTGSWLRFSTGRDDSHGFLHEKRPRAAAADKAVILLTSNEISHWSILFCLAG